MSRRRFDRGAFCAAWILLAAALAGPAGADLPTGAPWTLTTYLGPPEPDRILAAENDRAWIGTLDTLDVLDVSTPETPSVVGSVDLELPIALVFGTGGVAYATKWVTNANSALVRLDVSDPSQPVVGTTLVLTREAEGIALRGDRLLVANSYDGLRVYDVSAPGSFTETARLDNIALLGNHVVEALRVVVQGAFAYVAADVQVLPSNVQQTLLAVIDISIPDEPVVVGRYVEERQITGSVTGLQVIGDLAYLSKRKAFRIIDVSQPSAPFLRGSLLPAPSDFDNQYLGVVVDGDTAYLANWRDGLRFVDVRNPDAPLDLGREPGPFTGSGHFATSIGVLDGIAYLVITREAMQVVAVDGDRDGVPGPRDNCPAAANPGQEDIDGNGAGDACDVCPSVGFIGPDDSDVDGWADFCDICPAVFDPGQEDRDGNEVGDACNGFEDIDGDDHADYLDACPSAFDPDQVDLDGDGLGDVCDPFPLDADHERAQLEQDLQQALMTVEALEIELAVCLERPAFTDADGDGEADSTDACLGTPSGEIVDEGGCSPEQACGRSPVTTWLGWVACAAFDWRNDEPLSLWPGDCRPDWAGVRAGFRCRAAP